MKAHFHSTFKTAGCHFTFSAFVIFCLTWVFLPATLTEVTVVYQNGLPVISVSLPSRRERCQFTLKPLSDCVGVFLQQLQAEDRGIDRVAIYSMGMHINTRVRTLTLYPFSPRGLCMCMSLHAFKCSCILRLLSVPAAVALYQNLIPLHAP